MRFNFLMPLLCLCVTLAYSQDKLVFNYDSSGNQILRDNICLNCSASAVETPQDSLPAGINDPEAQDWLAKKFVASPNPVTNILNVEWVTSVQNKIEKISLFGGNNQLLRTLNTSNKINSAAIDFSNYPSGFYVLLVMYENGKTKTHKIIKK